MSRGEQVGRMQRGFPEVAALGARHRHAEVDRLFTRVQETLFAGFLPDLQQFHRRQNRNVERRSPVESHRLYERGRYLEIVLAVVSSVRFESERTVGTLDCQNFVPMFYLAGLLLFGRLDLNHRNFFGLQRFDFGLQLFNYLRFFIFVHVTPQKSWNVRAGLVDRTLHHAETMPLVPQVRIISAGHQVERLTVIPFRSRRFRQAMTFHPVGYHIDAVPFTEPQFGVEFDLLADTQFRSDLRINLVLVPFDRSVRNHQTHQLVIHPIDEIRRGEHRLRMLRAGVEPTRRYRIRVPCQSDTVPLVADRHQRHRHLVGVGDDAQRPRVFEKV